MQKKLKCWVVALCMTMFLGFAGSAVAYNQNSGLNFGNTNILDAILPGPGFYFHNYMAKGKGETPLLSYSPEEYETRVFKGGIPPRLFHGPESLKFTDKLFI